MSTIAWGQPTPTSRKFHAFPVAEPQPLLTRSLCGKYGYLGMDADQMDKETGERMRDECAACVKKLPRRAEPGGETP